MPNEPRKKGRPPASHKKLNLNICLSQREQKELEKLAGDACLSRSGWIQEAIRLAKAGEPSHPGKPWPEHIKDREQRQQAYAEYMTVEVDPVETKQRVSGFCSSCRKTVSREAEEAQGYWYCPEEGCQEIVEMER